MPVKPGKAALTKLVRKAGCASKIGQADLLRILKNLPELSDPNVLVGAAAGDDAGVYKLDDNRALVQTVDVFTPCVDDAYLFGQIAAANSLSDVYAMGGSPLTALSIVGFPIDELDGSILEEMLRGGLDKMAEAGCPVIGGHSINDAEIKCGFAVTGLIESGAVVRRDAAQPGDVLVITKPLGTGIVAFAAQLGRISPEALAEAGAAMATLNKDAAELMVHHGAHACTDVTGYGLAGHLVQMVRNSGVDAMLDLCALPLFSVVEQCLAEDIFSGAVERNQEYAMAWVEVMTEDDFLLPVIYDPQTSGGLLIALPEDEAEPFIVQMKQRGHCATTLIGRILERRADASDGKLFVRDSGLKKRAEARTTYPDGKRMKTMSDESCCSGGGCCDTPPADTGDAIALFTDFMKEVNKPGLIDARAKKLMAIALSVAQRCEPCLKIHMRTALSMGITMGEIDEAANLAIAFGGCTAMMFYKGIRERA
jgi:selenide,water dikinase